MGLTAHQEESLKAGLALLQEGNRLLISGSAGVGKTYMVNELIKRLMSRIHGKKVFCSAPTNKAVAVLKGKVDKDKRIIFETVHKALKIGRNVNNKTGQVTFKPWYSDKYPPLKGVGLFIIDEASMLNSELLDYVEEHADLQNCKVIFIGDHKQLNPVGEEVSPVFTEDYPEVELTEIIRQGEGSPIITLSRELELVKTKENNKLENGEGYIFSESLPQVIETLAAVNGTDELKYLAWTNREINKINSLVRQRLYGEKPKKVELGETLIFNEPYNDEFYTNQEILVEDVIVKTSVFRYPCSRAKGFNRMPDTKPIYFKVYSVNPVFCIDAQEKRDNIVVIHEDSEEDFKKLLKNLRSMCTASIIDWKDYYSFNEGFANITYNHAITVHKSQGSTYKQAIVNMKNIGLNKDKEEKEKLLYTAVTRASKLLILYKA